MVRSTDVRVRVRSGRRAETHHVQKHLRRHNEEVGRDAVTAHAILALLDRFVEAQLLLLRDGVHHHLVVHRGADVALRAPLWFQACNA